MSELIIAKTEQSPVARLLTALGVTFDVCSLEEAKNSKGSVLILSDAQFVSVCNAARPGKRGFTDLLPGFRDILVYPCAGNPEVLRALESVTGTRIVVSNTATDDTDYLVQSDRESCGPFAGLRISGVRKDHDHGLIVQDAACPVDYVVSSDSGAGLLTRFRLPGLNLFVASSTAVFDPSAEYLENLDARTCFSGLILPMLFLRQARIALPQSPYRWANWIIDDPNLTPRYGFLDLKALARSIHEAGAAATIAFIPWNHRRTSREVVGLFRENYPQLSICVHGCDHTGAEFSTKTMWDALPLVDLAIQRMNELKVQTALGFERVMVFPQGKFSAEAMRALRASEMLAAVNTELLDCQTGRGVTGEELLKPAITSFGGFPLFMRRAAEEPLANFALDLMLGKPCLVVTHHQYFEHGLAPLESMVASLNALQPGMAWTNLEQGIASTYSVNRIREKTAVRLYSARTELQAGMGEALVVTKAEGDPERVEVLVNERPVACRRANGGLEFTLDGRGNGAVTIEARAALPGIRPATSQSSKYRLKVRARRYLSEVRDNYVQRAFSLWERVARRAG
jgi:hypothetical protein